MRAAIVRETGGPEVLRVEEAEDPTAGDGEVLVRVAAAAVNPIDWKFRSGRVPKDLPAVLGSDIAGTIESSRAEGFAVGDPVFGFARTGAYAELAATPATLLAGRPPELDAVHAAALPVAGLTAWQALFDHGELQSGQTVLVTGAAGGVGHLAVQFAKRAGARVIGTGSARNREHVLGLGADEFVDYGSQDVATAVSGVDLAFDTVGGDTTEAALATVRDGGKLVRIVRGGLDEAAGEARGVRSVLFTMQPDSGQLKEIGLLVAGGEVTVEIAKVLALAEIARAHELSESGHARGKIILSIP
jgi:NADPH:quinone reductase-like Zn-dependent oxidoreductase